jgi:hypothetical protein
LAIWNQHKLELLPFYLFHCFFSTLWQWKKMFQAHLVLALASPVKSAILQGITFCIVEWYLEINIWVLGMLTATGDHWFSAH